MNTLTLTFRSLRFYRRTHLGVLLGCALTTTVLTGALLIGDSVRYSLRQFALMRLGRVTHAINTGNRFFAAGLADRIDLGPGNVAAPLLQLQGSAMRQGRSSEEFLQIHRVQILGVDDRFWRLSSGPILNLQDGEIAVNQRMAQELNVAAGEEISLRVARPSLLPRDAPLSSRKDKLSIFVTLKIKVLVPDSHLGRFSLEANQASPRNAFVSLDWLQRESNLAGRANRLLVAMGKPLRTPQDLQSILGACWNLQRTGATLRTFNRHGVAQLESDRVFLDPAVARAALAVPGASPPVGVLSYLVNSISAGNGPNRRSTPYSFMNACSPAPDSRLSLVPPGMKDNEIVINRWLADQLAAQTGTTVTVAFYELLPSGDFAGRQREFTVRSIVEMDRHAAEKELMPEFPGLSDADSCKDWDIGMPVDEQMLKDKANEEYWNRYRQTPKAFVTLRAGQAMWANRFGDLTAVRYPADQVPDMAALTRAVNPAELGLVFLPVREQGLSAVENATDFGGLFLGMSFFLIASALILTALLFGFGVEQRAGETGTLLALGCPPRRVQKALLSEGSLIAVGGAVVGAAAGTQYAHWLIWALTTWWPDAVARSAVQYHGSHISLAGGALAGFLAAVFAIALAIRRQIKRPVSQLLTADFTQTLDAGPDRPAGKGMLVLSLAALAAAVAVVIGAVLLNPENPSETFFGAGMLLLLAGLGLTRHVLRAAAFRSPVSPRNMSSPASALWNLGLRNTARRLKRSMTIVALLASASFLVFSVASMKTDVRAHADKPWSGTGGFDFFVETTLPVPEKPDSPSGRKRINLGADERLHGVDIVAVKVREGDDASCFNLNRAQVPRLLGVNPRDFLARRAFVPRGSSGDAPWDLLERLLPDGSIPALAGDSNTAMWGLKGSGASIEYRDERGNPFKVRIVGNLPARISVFQGAVLVSDRFFTERYPSEDGFRVWLVRAPADRKQDARQALAARLDRFGPDIALSADRIAGFYSVESAYLAMFLALGGLGLLFGTIGMAVVVLRNTQERRAELALLRAVGFGPRQIQWLVLSEHGLLLFAGLLVGTCAALLAMIPAFRSPGLEMPWPLLAATFLAVALSGILWTWLAAAWAVRGPLIPALRNE